MGATTESGVADPADDAAPRFLVTAGNTRERIDAVRDWGNIFTGNTGLAIAKALAGVGAIDLLTSNPAHVAELSAGPAGAFPVRAIGFRSHGELKGALAALMAGPPYAAVFMTAAVADYRPERVYEVIERRPDPDDSRGGGAGARGGREVWVVRDAQAAKVKSSHEAIAVLGRRTEKLVDLFRTAWGHAGLLVKFKLEVGVTRDDLLAVGEASRVASGADYLVANSLEMVEGDGAGAFLLKPGGHEWVPRAQLAARMVRLVAERRGAEGEKRRGNEK